jgi:hypothetical protein
VSVPDPHQPVKASARTRAQAFEDAEASLRLEGLDPNADPRYLGIKRQLLAGTLTFDEAEAALKAHFIQPGVLIASHHRPRCAGHLRKI